MNIWYLTVSSVSFLLPGPASRCLPAAGAGWPRRGCRVAGYRNSIDIIDSGGYIYSPECRAGSWRAGAGGGWRGACCSWPGWCRPWPAAGAPSCPGTPRTRRGPAPAGTWNIVTLQPLYRHWRFKRRSKRRFVIALKGPTNPFTFKNLLRH